MLYANAHATRLVTLAVVLAAAGSSLSATEPVPTLPGVEWVVAAPADVGLDAARLRDFSDYIGGRGCVVRHGRLVHSWGDFAKRGDVASAAKPVYAHFLFQALDDGRLESVDEPVVRWEPRLGEINTRLGFKDRDITWQHLANQTSCYQVTEKPGTAYCYNDFQMALFWDTMFLKLYDATYDSVDDLVLYPLLTNVLECEDRPTFMAFGTASRAGRLAISPRDFCRFGLLYLREGNWNGRQVISREHARQAVSSPLPAELSRAGRDVAEMIPGQRSIGSERVPDNQTDHFGSYSWLWWVNGVDRDGARNWPSAPEDTFGAFGHGGIRAMFVMPGLDIVASYNDARWDDATSHGADSQVNEAMRRLVAAVVDDDDKAAAGTADFKPQTRISIDDRRWLINGEVTYPGAPAEGRLMNVRMVNCTFEDRNRGDFDPDANTAQFLKVLPDYAAAGVRAFTLCLQGGMPGYEGALNSAFEPDGSLRPGYLARVARVIEACDRQGVAVILGCYYQRQDQVLQDEDAVRRGVVETCRWLQRQGYTNVVVEIANEYWHGGFDHRILRSDDGEAELIRLAKQTAPGLLVSASGLGGGRTDDKVARAADFLLIHFNSTPVEDISERFAVLQKYGKPIVCNEDDKTGDEAARAAAASVAAGGSWGFMHSKVNQYFPLEFHGAADDPVVYAELKRLTTPQ
jgi:CubicO group peptidase (beta-lactamase class C family)